MTVHTSTVGYYAVHYKGDATIQVEETNLRPINHDRKIAKAPGFVPMLLAKELVQMHRLPSAVVWRAT